jgi:3',5'-cyclic-AMP phosphodiesterase
VKRRTAMRDLAIGSAASVIGLQPKRILFAADPRAAIDRQRSSRFVHFTDVHVQSGHSAANGLARAIQHVHALPDQPDFILNGGDAIDDALEHGLADVEMQWALWTEAWRSNGSLPVRNCLGNHDVWGWNKKKSRTTGSEPGWGKQVALDHLELEKSYYRFDHGKWRFIVLDSMTFDEETAYHGELDGAQFEWLGNELQQTPVDTPVVIVSHIPILTVGTVGFTDLLRKHPQGHRMLSHQDAFELLELFRQFRNIKLCLSGHTHLTEEISYAGINFVNSGAVCGQWWKGSFHHTVEGYNVVDLYDDGTYRTEYLNYGWKAV